jgi:hypothetical protein
MDLRFYVLSYEEFFDVNEASWALETHGRRWRHACMFTGKTDTDVYAVYTWQDIDLDVINEKKCRIN